MSHRCRCGELFDLAFLALTIWIITSHCSVSCESADTRLPLTVDAPACYPSESP